jgi:hypothetical protein
VDIDVKTLVVDHVIQDLGRLKDFGGQIILVEVVNGEMDCLDVALSVVLQHFGPVYSTMIVIYFSLNVKNSCYSSVSEFLSIFLQLRVLP